MAHAYLTERQMPRTFWFYAITHAARMMNAIPGKIHGRLASPFLLVHGVGHNERTWVPIFSLCYFHHEKDGEKEHSKHQAHTMDGIFVGHSTILNALLVYNPCNKQYYKPSSYRIDSYCLPGSIYRNIKCDGGLFCTLICNNNFPMEEKYSTRTWVECLNPSTKMLLAGTVMDNPLPDDLLLDGASSHTILFDNCTTMSITPLEMAAIITKPPVDISPSNSQDSLLPQFLCLNSKIIYEQDGQYHKGYLGIKDGVHGFVFKSHVNKRKEDWDVSLPNLPTTWVDMCIKGILIPGHVPHTFLQSSASPQQSKFDPVTLLVSTMNLHWECPLTLLWALADVHPNCTFWLQSYYEEKARNQKSWDIYENQPWKILGAL
jgi:hypothetical protein